MVSHSTGSPARHQGTALKHCPKELQEDRSLQLAAVEAGGPQGSAALEPWQHEQIRLIFIIFNCHNLNYLYIHMYMCVCVCKYK